MIAAITADAFTVLALRRSILTEKISRRGYHLSREYSVDPLEILFVREVMRTSLVVLPAEVSLQELSNSLRSKNSRGQRLYPVLNGQGKLAGVLTRGDLYRLIEENTDRQGPVRLAETLRTTPKYAYPDEPLRVVVYRMAETGFTRFPVVDRNDPTKLLGIVSLDDLLKARVANLEAEERRERVLRIRYLFPFQSKQSS
jgi:CBS domain-containing protein